MSSYEQVLTAKTCTRLTTYSSTVCNTYKNKLFQTLIRVLVYATKETPFQQYFALKVYTFSYSPYPLYLPFEKGILWKQFRETIRIMRLIPHKHAINHFQKLSSNHETTLELLMDLQFKADLSEYQDIMGYLHYWQHEH